MGCQGSSDQLLVQVLGLGVPWVLPGTEQGQGVVPRAAPCCWESSVPGFGEWALLVLWGHLSITCVRTDLSLHQQGSGLGRDTAKNPKNPWHSSCVCWACPWPLPGGGCALGSPFLGSCGRMAARLRGSGGSGWLRMGWPGLAWPVGQQHSEGKAWQTWRCQCSHWHRRPEGWVQPCDTGATTQPRQEGSSQSSPRHCARSARAVRTPAMSRGRGVSVPGAAKCVGSAGGEAGLAGPDGGGWVGR